VKVSSFETEIFQNELFQRGQRGEGRQSRADALPPRSHRGLQQRRRAPEDKRARARSSATASPSSARVQKNVRDNTTKLTFTPAEHAGLALHVDRLKNADGTSPSGSTTRLHPFMNSGDNEKARERYYIAYMKRGTARNLAILDEVVKLRKELATLYGYPSYAHYVTKRRMSETPQAVNTFLDDVAKSVKDVEKRELDDLRKLKSGTLKTPLASTKLNRWDVSYWREKLRAQRYAIDQESTRKYFPSDATREWIIDITSRMYGVKFEPAQVPVCTRGALYGVKEASTGAYVGGVYLDLYPRDGKYKHAAAIPMRHGSTRSGRRPISVLMTNFDREGLTADDVETFFHEFGHVMHNTLSNTEFASQGGTSVQRDFVEAPSQIYEEWACRPETLALLKAHCKDCPELDAKTIKALDDARNYGKGIDYARQHNYAAFDMAIAGETPSSSMDAWKKVEGASLLGFVPGTEFPGTFAHLVGGYAAGYYGYMWSEVIGKDMLSMWGDNILDSSVGMRFRKQVLARGGEQPAKVVVEEFLGRPVNSKAFFDELRGK
jgi:thimet oligopeptidase